MNDFDESKINGENGLVSLSVPTIGLALLPMLLIALISSYWMQLGIASSIAIGSARTFVQLSILGLILRPIFYWGKTHMWSVVGYCLLMVMLAAYETSKRSKYYFKGQFYGIFSSLLLNVTLVGCFAFAVIIRPVPMWDPQYVIPIVGMLLGNSINGISISLDAATKALVEQKHEIELYLSFGASSYEAVSRLMREAVRAGAMPMINSMMVIGLVSIPGMMTGQILAGAPILEASRYQILIIYLISVSTFGSILMEIWISLNVGFDSMIILRTDRFTKRTSKSSLISFFSGFNFLSPKEWDRTEILKPLRKNDNLEAGNINSKEQYQSINGGIEMFHEALPSSYQEKFNILEVQEISHATSTQILFEKISFSVKAGRILVLSGKSGCGKSTLLRIIARLTPLQEGNICLTGISPHGILNRNDITKWRRCMRYVSQSKVDIPGTPLDFIHRITSFQSWKIDNNAPTEQEMLSSTKNFIKNLLLTDTILQKEWSTLSGGEAQRVMVALALASNPKVLLLDESTSALDNSNKIILENMILQYAKQFGVGVVWISHDKDQLKRLLAGT